jgi:2-succinyl-5-enolpyruvyl-6-hydroxy-3-cyclohexene-1-carboxylate synthase
LAQEAISSSAEWSEGRVAAAVSQVKCDALFISSSRPIRDIEAFALGDSRTSAKRIFANRGLAGIDGNISTAMGIATKHERTIALIGDLAFLHDLSSLANQIEENLTLVVVDNDGGGIFSTLPQAGVDHFEEVFGTAHGRSIKKISTAMGLKAVEVDNVSDLLAEIDGDGVGKGIKVVVAKMPSREENAKNLKLINERFASLASQ